MGCRESLPDLAESIIERSRSEYGQRLRCLGHGSAARKPQQEDEN
jgi:hypothetical protein